MSDISFGTDGWRDRIAEGFTFANVRIVAAAVGATIIEQHGTRKPVLVGHDTRFLGRAFAETVTCVLEHMGLEVLVATRDVPTPVIAHAARDLDTAGAIQLTASHNPAEYGGIKYIPEYAGPATKEITDRIVAAVRRIEASGEKLPTGRSAGKPFDPTARYLEDVRQLVDLEAIRRAAPRVVYDPLYATGRGYLDTLLHEAGVPVEVLHGSPDPLFGGGMPEPAVSQLGELIARVQSAGADLGLSTDGDADRFGVVDAAGTFYSPNQVLALLARHLVKNRRHGGAIVRTVATTHLLDRLAERYGLPVRETPVGFKWVGACMREEEVLIGGEESGGLSIGTHIPEKDGVLANLLVVEMVAMEGKPLAAIWRDLVEEVGYDPANRRLDLHLAPGVKEELLEAVQTRPPAHLAGRAVQQVKGLDGVQLLLEGEAWVLVRPSGTEPLVRVYMEAPDQGALAGLMGAVRDWLAPFTGEVPVSAHA
ncbi:MAG: phosphoglucomutase/phosphomannomutase family protein [bacterium]|nr:phosphoglucomutase/phosphomannomutase family protein [bacterium]